MNSKEFLDAARLKPNFFTRSRKLPFATLMAFLLSGIRGAVQGELDAFFASLRNQADRQRQVSAQAFYKARHQLRADAFSQLGRHLMTAIESEIQLPRWNGLRLVAGDASTMRLTQVDNNNVRHMIDAVAFGLFLPGVELCLASTLYQATACNERQMLIEHLDYLQKDDLLILDRGYPCAWLAALLTQRGIPFCIRCDMASTFTVVQRFARSSEDDAIVTLPAPRHSYAADYGCEALPTRVRLVRACHPCGRSIILMTSLLDAQTYPAASFGDLYHARWRIEEGFKRWKHKLNLEHTSGLSWLAACQDFGAKAICDNLVSLAAWLAHDGKPPEDPNKLYKVNRTLALGTLKPHIGRWLLRAIPIARKIATPFGEIRKNLQRLRPGRQQPRPRRPKRHLSHAYKPVV